MKPVNDTYRTPDGREYPVGGLASYYRNILRDDAGEPVERKGLGTFRVFGTVENGRPSRFASWIYVTPDGREVPTSVYLKDHPEPPPLPRPRSAWRTCGCFRHGGKHVCSACGQPYWVELHGVADGFCTYCYYRG